jgi:hypothetical protein
MLAQGHAPLDTCHLTSSGVPVHLVPGCTCGTPSQMVDIHDKDGNKVGEHEVKVPGHVMVVESGKPKSITLDQARNAGYIV